MAGEYLGAPPEEIARDLLAFSKSTELLSKDHDLVDTYQEKWIGVFRGEVKAAEADFDALLTSLDRQGIPRSGVAVRFIEREPRTLIL